MITSNAISYQKISNIFTALDIYSLGVMFYEIVTGKLLGNQESINFLDQNRNFKQFDNIIKPMVN